MDQDAPADLRPLVEELADAVQRLRLEVLQLRREYVDTQLHLLRRERGEARLEEDPDAIALMEVLASLRRRIERHA